MFDNLMEVNHAMLGDIKQFMTGRAIETTAGAYLSQFASLHISVMTNILGSLKCRTEGDRYVFQTVSGCYALRVYEFATAALQSRMAALEEHEENNGKQKCCPSFGGQCTDCPKLKGSFKTPGSLNAVGRIQDTLPLVFLLDCVFRPPPSIHIGYPRHASRIILMRCKSKRLAFGRIGLRQFPWLNSVVLMQQIEVHKEELLRDIEFDCSAI